MEDQSETIEFLSRAETYDSGEPVERRETHAAIVFLAGGYAYKLKRAVRYSYLDYSTAERRRAMCQAELAVNRRTAPDLYLRVQPIIKREGKLCFGAIEDAAKAVDWVVVMRRFAESDLLERKLESGEVSDELFSELAGAIAQFHQSAEPQPDFGGSAAIACTIAESAELIKSFSPRPFDPKLGERLRTLSAGALSRIADLLDRRKQSGFVRRCHGDLHLDNICILNRHPVLFDAIEFNDDFTNIDVFYDLAFLLMDLDHHRARRAANVVLNRYLEITADYEGAGALSLFLSCRAAVRAHVAATTADRFAGHETDRLRSDAVSLLQQAVDYLSPVGPRLIAIGGISGTGKSLLARNLAPFAGAAPGAVVLRSDVIRKRLFGVRPEVRLPPSAYSAEVTAKVYAEMRRHAELLLRFGHSVIADAVHGTAEERSAIEAVSQRANAGFAGLWLAAEPSEIGQRLSARSGDASDADVLIARQQFASVTRPADWNLLEVARRTPAECAAATASILNLADFTGTCSVYR